MHSPVWAPQSYVDCAWVGELLLFRKACQTGLGTTISPLVPRDGAVLPNKDASTQLCLQSLIPDRLLTQPTWDDCLLWLSLKTDLWAPT